MNAYAVLLLALAVLACLLCTLVLGIALRRLHRVGRERRRGAAEQAVRPRVVSVLADESADAAERLRAAWQGSGRSGRRVLEAVVFAYLGKVRGPARDVLVEFLGTAGAVARARTRARRIGVVGRARAAEVLGRIGGAEDVLVALLTDRRAVVRQVAVAGLRSAPPTRQVVAALLACVDGDRRVPPAIVTETLVRMGPGTAPLLAQALSVPLPPPVAAAGRHRSGSGRAAGRRGGATRAAPDPGGPGRAVAAEALGLLGTAESTGVLVAAVDDRSGDLEVRVRSARALGRIGSPAGLGPLLRCLEPAEPAVLRTVAARALGELGSPRAVPHLVPLLSGPHRLATNAASALARLGPAGGRALAAVADRDPGSPAARYAEAALVTRDLARSDAAAAVVPTLAG